MNRDPNLERGGLADNLFEQLCNANTVAAQHGKIGRQQFARDVHILAGTWSAHKPADVVLQEIIDLCKLEAIK